MKSNIVERTQVAKVLMYDEPIMADNDDVVHAIYLLRPLTHLTWFSFFHGL